MTGEAARGKHNRKDGDVVASPAKATTTAGTVREARRSTSKESVSDSGSVVNEKLRATLDYVRRGWAVIPNMPRGKRPFARLLPRVRDGGKVKHSWLRLLEERATEPQVREWLAKYPDINIGIGCGAASGGLVVIEFDTQELPAWWTPPQTAIAKSSRGLHFYFHASFPVKTTPHGCGEVRGDGVQTIAVGSTHETGWVYSWLPGCSLDEVGIAELTPEMLMQIPGQTRENDTPTPLPSSSSWYLEVPRRKRGEEESAAVETADVSFVQAWMSKEEVALGILEACGRPGVKVGVPFCCPLPGHEETTPSAALYKRYDGTYGLRDYHQRDGEKWYSLGEVYYACKTGKTVKLKDQKAVMVSWFLRALIELGFCKTPALLTPRLPLQVKKLYRDVYDGFRFLLEVRTLYDAEQAQHAPYTRRFARDWCSHGEVQCGEAINWLMANGFLRCVEKRGALKAGILAFGASTAKGVGSTD